MDLVQIFMTGKESRCSNNQGMVNALNFFYKTAYANSADPDLSDQGLHCHFTKCFKKQLYKKQNIVPQKNGIKCLKF